MSLSLLEEFAKAIEKGDCELVQPLIRSGSVDVNARLPRFGEPPALVHAVHRRKPAIVDLLLRANARVDEADNFGITPVHVVAPRNDADSHDTLALLLAHRPNLGLMDSFKRTPLQRSFEAADNAPVSLMLLEAGASLEGAEAYLCPFAASSTAAIRALLDRGVVVRDLCSESGQTPLHIASSHRNLDVAVLNTLVNVCGVDLDSRDQRGYSCLHAAAANWNAVALQWLISAGADVNCTDHVGATALSKWCDYNCTVYLLAAGADPCVRNAGDDDVVAPLAGPPHDVAVLHALLSADQAATDGEDTTAHRELARRGLAVNLELIGVARRDIAKARLDFVRRRALQVCISLQPLGLDALQMCEILLFACGPVAPLIRFHEWWKIATIVKHFHSQ